VHRAGTVDARCVAKEKVMKIPPLAMPLAAAVCVLLFDVSASRAELCNAHSSGKPATFYDGDSAGFVYDRLFKDSKRELARFDHVPQGLATYSNYEGKRDMLLLASYEPPEGSALVIGIDPITGVALGAVKIDSFHAGGIAVFEELGWAFVSGPKLGGEPSISRFALKDLEAQIKQPDSLKDPEHLPPRDTVVFPTSSAITSHGPTNTLWVAHHNPKDNGYMLSYKVHEDGRLVQEPGKWEIPKKVQGVVVTKDSFIFSTSLGRNNRSNIYVVRREDGHFSLADSKLQCFRAPSMTEGIAVYGDNLLLVFESAADKYRTSDDAPRNIIPTWHYAPMVQLEALPPTR
jgi:hypothetical protein